MPAKKTLPYGTWPSPVTPALVARGSSRFGTVQVGGDAVYWTRVAARGGRAGRSILRAARGAARSRSCCRRPFSARSRVHEYGGGEFLVAGEHDLFRQRQGPAGLRLEPGAPPRRITDAPGMRFADFALDARARPPDRRRRDAPAGARPAATRCPATCWSPSPSRASRAGRRAGRRAATSMPARASRPTARRLAFLAWDLPDMPWDSATLYVARRSATTASSAGPRASPAATAAPSSSRSGAPTAASTSSGTRPVGASSTAGTANASRACTVARGAELMRPQWVFGSRSYALAPRRRASGWSRSCAARRCSRCGT